jgi:hypothetical protein
MKLSVPPEVGDDGDAINAESDNGHEDAPCDPDGTKDNADDDDDDDSEQNADDFPNALGSDASTNPDFCKKLSLNIDQMLEQLPDFSTMAEIWAISNLCKSRVKMIHFKIACV